jgi:CBS domain-containing protein
MLRLSRSGVAGSSDASGGRSFDHPRVERKETSMTTTYAQHMHPAPSLDSVRVSEAMHRGVVTCRPDTTLHTVARLMAAHRIHAVVVTPEADGEERRLVSDLDLVAAVADGSLGDVTVGRISSAPSVFVTPDDTIAHAAQLMREYETHHVVVLAGAGHGPVGILSTLDIADVVADLPRVSAVVARGAR